MKFVDFKAISEPWNRYELQDGTDLKTRFILVTVIVDGLDEAGNPIYSINSDMVIGVIPAEGRIGQPSEKTYTQEEKIEAIEEELDFETKKEDWAEYMLEDGVKLQIKLTLVKVARTSLHDPKGVPLYLVNSQPLTKASIPKELRPRLKELYG